MSDTNVEFLRFHHVTLAVTDFGAAVTDWTDRLGWAPSARAAATATFPLDDAYIEIVPAGDRGPGVTSVSVVVDDVEDTVERLRANGVSFTMSLDGHAVIDPKAVNGVPLELRPDDADGGGADPASTGAGGPYRRFNHIIVAVSDDTSAVSSWAAGFGAWTEEDGHTVEAVHHVPVGIAWFGLTGSGTDAGALARFIERRGEGIYGLALVVDDHPATIHELEGRGAQIIRQESSGQTFVHPKTSHGILIDLVPERHPSRV
jgi:catechol 2,3-dioxygenase-like lactoylglutathione lyase family enzyme